MIGLIYVYTYIKRLITAYNGCQHDEHTKVSQGGYSKYDLIFPLKCEIPIEGLLVWL